MHSIDIDIDASQERQTETKKKSVILLVLVSFVSLSMIVGIFLALYLNLHDLNGVNHTDIDDMVGYGDNSDMANGHPHEKYPTIVVSLDGFRYDYLQRGLTPHLDSLKDNGYYADYMTPQFPSKTFPNHYSLATGLLPKYHGIFGNHMYDPVAKKAFSTYDPSWFGGEPIWVTAEKANIPTACYFWFGCSVPIKNRSPSLNYPNYTTTDSDIIFNQIGDWRVSYKDGMNGSAPLLTMAYIYEVDDRAHTFGPESSQVNDEIVKVDRNVGDLISRLKQNQLFNKTNIIIVSDHGMASLSSSRVINLDDYFNTSCVVIGDLSPISFLFPIDGLITKEQLYESLAHKHPNMSVYYREDIPAHYQLYQDSLPYNARLSPVFVVADLGWQVVTNKMEERKGDHGYDNQETDMRAIFIAHGPNIKSRLSMPTDTLPTSFRNVELYNLLISLLGIDKTNAALNNGTTLLSDKIFKFT
ncbi:hypothetical protein CYY_005126 [Polysphondylium violaceum]|uniref:Type I phosphodiesterase/nucleotide pyrophosphatase family protein n=1 Tax=Polysphondylium violaceum TaxID=133409 RepID=A0A8J4V4I6_9MYCE|nr:hypothetical protein CYY_005126 [Polysphondylium violaceum]